MVSCSKPEFDSFICDARPLFGFAAFAPVSDYTHVESNDESLD